MSEQQSIATTTTDDLPQTGSRFWLRLRRQHLALIALIYLSLLVLVALLATWLAPYDPAEQNLRAALQLPSADHWLGTDNLGRDTLSRLIFGGRLALLAALQGVSIAMLLGVPILEALNITRETSGNAVFEELYGRVYDSIREGESIAKPMREYSRTKFNFIAAFFWTFFIPVIGLVIYLTRATQRIIDDLVVNMIDVGEETGELDKMLYKVADNYDEEVDVLTESLVSLLEPILIVVLGVIVGFIVIALFLPLVALIQKLS